MRVLKTFLLCLGLILSVNLPGQSVTGPILESDLPIIAIQSGGKNIIDEPKTNMRMAVLADPSGSNQLISELIEYPYHIGIELRGQSSLTFFPKKSYAFETRDSLGENLNCTLLGLPKENDWILHGPYSDKTLIRNKLIYDLGNQIMDWAPRSIFCELVIDEDYQGVYLLMEKIKRDNDRVDIAKCIEKDTIGDDLTGGYIIRIDKGERNQETGWSSHLNPNGVFFQYYYPKSRDIQDQQKAYIQNVLRQFEDCLAGNDFNDPQLGYSQYIDIESFIDYLILNEFSKNIDGYRFSTYLYKDKDSKGGKLKMGPIWD
jgi:hypothetical protein